MKKSLYELGLEYEESIKDVQKTAASVRLKLKAAERAYDSDKAYSLRRKLTVLYEEITEMKIIAEKLKNYYGTEKREESAA